MLFIRQRVFCATISGETASYFFDMQEFNDRWPFFWNVDHNYYRSGQSWRGMDLFVPCVCGFHFYTNCLVIYTYLHWIVLDRYIICIYTKTKQIYTGELIGRKSFILCRVKYVPFLCLFFRNMFIKFLLFILSVPFGSIWFCPVFRCMVVGNSCSVCP